ncbi:HEAT repeat protein [Streptomyces laurentii]|uniref:HEAT repeat protein n=1 Tax=Streptomyces laurentii TaxID=39478 RepID=A0A160NXZ1_STRLU|nr:HEAT repeat protein [Streptomyces laurentii]
MKLTNGAGGPGRSGGAVAEGVPDQVVYGDGQETLHRKLTNTARATATDPRGGHVSGDQATATIVVEVKQEHGGYGRRTATRA